MVPNWSQEEQRPFWEVRASPTVVPRTKCRTVTQDEAALTGSGPPNSADPRGRFACRPAGGGAVTAARCSVLRRPRVASRFAARSAGSRAS